MPWQFKEIQGIEDILHILILQAFPVQVVHPQQYLRLILLRE
jgi:hypothetical protein